MLKILDLPKDVLYHLSKYLDDGTCRNYMICCKTIYNSFPVPVRRQKLQCLSYMHHLDMVGRPYVKRKGECCPRCNIYISKRLEKRYMIKCMLKQCYNCWSWIETYNLMHVKVCELRGYTFK